MNSRLAALLLVPIALTVSGCEGPRDPAVREQVENLTANWNTLEDGSKFALVSDSERYRRIAMRCWPQSDSSHLCITVEEVTGVYSRTAVSRSTETSLPEVLWGLSGDGYRCQFVMGITEEVAVGTDALISNSLSETGRAWTRGFVDDYIKRNKVNGSRHFKCLDVLRAILDGSPKTLGTTTIGMEMAT